jgi:hypothetical protein
VDDAHAAASAAHRLAEKSCHRLARLGTRHAVQVELVLDDPISTPQLPQQLARETLAHERSFLARFQGSVGVEWPNAALRERGVLVEERLNRHRWRAPSTDDVALGRP